MLIASFLSITTPPQPLGSDSTASVSLSKTNSAPFKLPKNFFELFPLKYVYLLALHFSILHLVRQIRWTCNAIVTDFIKI